MNVEDLSDFKFDQEEVIFDKYLEGGKASFNKIKVQYKIKSKISNALDKDKIPLLMPVKDLPELLIFTLNKLKKNKVTDCCNIFIIDDRSGPEIKQICDKHSDISYVRVDNQKGFNYSNLINIGAYISSKLGFTQIITWNSDMWPPDEKTVPELIKRHNQAGCTISGTKLLYPLEAWDGEEVTKNISYHYPNKKETFRGTVQYGGSIFVPYGNTISTDHLKRFGDPQDPLINQDYATFFVTGAYSLIELSWLLPVHGLNPSFSKIFNDSDMCLRAVEDGKTIMYFGKDIFLNHDESVNNINETKIDKQFNSDMVLWTKVWPAERAIGIIK